MHDTMIRAYLALGAFRERLAGGHGDQRGQATAEYVGVILLLVAVIGVIASTAGIEEIGTSIKNAVRGAIDKISGN